MFPASTRSCAIPILRGVPEEAADADTRVPHLKWVSKCGSRMLSIKNLTGKSLNLNIGLIASNIVDDGVTQMDTSHLSVCNNSEVTELRLRAAH